MARQKRKATSPSAPQKPTKRPQSPRKTPVKTKATMEDRLSPTAKINVLKLDVISCNGRDVSLVELGAADLEKIWTEGILRELGELTGYTSHKGDSVIRIQYQLKRPMSLRDIVLEAEFNFERSTARGLEILKVRVVGLSGLRPAAIGERVKLSIIKPNFDVSPEQAIEWVSRFGRVHENHRYDILS